MSDLNQFGSLSEFRIGPISTDRFGVLSAQVFVERHEDPTDFDLSIFLAGKEPKFILLEALELRLQLSRGSYGKLHRRNKSLGRSRGARKVGIGQN